jgi:hypothetical protein
VLSDKLQPMQVDFVYDPWDDERTQKLFLPTIDEHPMDAIARRIDLLLDAWTTPDGYKMIVEGFDPLKNCTELDKIKILEKSMYLIAAITSALKVTQLKHGPVAVRMPVNSLSHPTSQDKCNDGGVFSK